MRRPLVTVARVTAETPSATAEAADRAAVQDVVDRFFAAFRSGPGSGPRLDALRELFLPEAVIVRTLGEAPVAYDVDGFIAPRAELLSGGRLADFSEAELSGRIDVFGDIAAYLGRYEKSGVDAGVPFTGRGMKAIHLVRTAKGWRISAVAWDDERGGLSLKSS